MIGRLYCIILFMLTLIGLSSCVFSNFKWGEICYKNPSDFSFFLVTEIQSYQLDKKNNAMTITADTYYYPSSSQKARKDIAFSKVLKGGDEEIEKLIIELIKKGEFIPLSSEYACLPEGIHNSMELHLNGKKYRWNLLFAEEMKDRGVVSIYTQLNERLFYLFPELKNLPTSFPFSQNPPEHMTGKIWSWYERE